MTTLLSAVNKAVPFGASATVKGKDVTVKSKDREGTKKIIESYFTKNKIIFKSTFKKSKSGSIDVLEVTGLGDIIFKPIIQKGAGGLKFEDELKQDIINFYQGAEDKDIKHNDVIKKLVSVLSLSHNKKLTPDKRGGKNQSRALTFTGNKVSINNTSGKYITDITLMDQNNNDKHHLSLKMSDTFYILNAGIGKYFADKNTQAEMCEFFGFEGQRMAGFGDEYACITKPPRVSTVKSNLEDLLSEAYGYDMVLVHKKRENDVLVKEIKTAPPVTVSNLDAGSYRYPDPGVRKYANISVNANIAGTRYKVDFQFRGTTAADRGPRYLRILMKRL